MTYLTQMHTRHPYNDPHLKQYLTQRTRHSVRAQIPLDALPIMVVVTNKDGNILDINQIGADLLGYAKTELLGKHLTILTKPSDEKQAPEFRRTFSQETHTHTSSKVETFVRKNSSSFPANVSTTRLPSQNGEERFLTTITDCTEHQKKLHAAQMYVIGLLHDTRGSLGVIQNGLGLLQTCELSPEIQGYINAIGIGTTDIESVVNDTLDLAKVLEKDTPELSECYLHAFLEKALKPSQALAKVHKKTLTLTLDILPTIYCSIAKRAFAVVLRNLLSNAIKFTPDCKTPICCEISLAPTPTPDGTFLLSFKVTNQGRGFTEQEKTRIFTHFQQASSEISEKFGGTGIGLPQSKEAIERAGGTLDAESVPIEQEPNEDGDEILSEATAPSRITTFFGTIPIRITKVPATLKVETTELKTPRTPSAGKKVLFVDDQSVPRKLGSASLKKTGGHKVETAGNVDEAIIKAENVEFDVLVTDMDLKEERNGIQLAQTLKKSPRQTKRPLKTILITGSLDTQTIELAKAAGIDECILKGGSPQILLDAIDRICTPAE